MEHIFGYIERITFHNEENGFTVARLKEPRKNQLTCIVGVMPGIQPGESVRCTGTWKSNTAHGMQFEVTECKIEAPADLIGIQKYLASGLIHGIGPVFAQRILQKFGLKTLEVIDQNPDALLEVEGIGEKRVELIKSCWQSQKSIRQVMLFLQSYDISPTYAHKIYRHYGEEALNKLRENPFQLAQNVAGIGFKKADAIAEKMGFLKNSSQRIEGGIEYVLTELARDGHVCYPLDKFLEIAKGILEIDHNLIQEQLVSLEKEERIILKPLEIETVEQDFIWSKVLYLSELGIAREIKRILYASSSLRAIDVEKALIWVQEKLNIQLADNQKKAVGEALSGKCHIITGGPGTGKSTITKAILTISCKLTKKIILAAPTGRAAKRMKEITGEQAFTIHSLLQYDFKLKGFRRNRENPLDCDLIIIDEASMIDTYLMYSLLKAIPCHARFICVGDIHQLPSVGPGNVLKDLIESKKIAATQLTEIFRQAAGSKIILNAHKINQGIFPDLKADLPCDFFFVKANTPEEVLEKLLNLVTKRLPRTYRFDPIEDIQILTPMKRGVIGTENLNLALQSALNPQKEMILQGGYSYSLHDKVMQIRNNYKKEVYNGDIGRITHLDKEKQEITVNFDGHYVVYSFQELDELVLAYATSIHKSQGSEYPCSVILIHTTHFTMLHRNLLYTAVTRGKRLVVLVGTGQGIAIAVSNDEVKKRFTGLNQALQEQICLQESSA